MNILPLAGIRYHIRYNIDWWYKAVVQLWSVRRRTALVQGSVGVSDDEFLHTFSRYEGVVSKRRVIIIQTIKQLGLQFERKLLLYALQQNILLAKGENSSADKLSSFTISCSWNCFVDDRAWKAASIPFRLLMIVSVLALSLLSVSDWLCTVMCRPEQLSVLQDS